MMLVGNNPKDPLNWQGSELSRQLYSIVLPHCANYPCENVMDAGLNLFINALRQSAPNVRQASELYDQVMARYKEVLMKHYDPSTGNRRNIFPFNQHVQAPLVIDKDKF